MLFVDTGGGFLLFYGVLGFVVGTLHIHEEVLLVFLLLLSHNALELSVLREVGAAFRCCLLGEEVVLYGCGEVCDQLRLVGVGVR